MHDINASTPDRPPSGDSLIVCILVSLGLCAVAAAAVVAFSVWWPTFVRD